MHKQLKALSLFITSFALLLTLLPNLALAQTTPTSQPLVQQGDMVYLGKFTYPWSDGAGGTLSYGYKTLGMGADGASLYVGCIYGPIARISIPAIGGVAKVLEPCAKPANLSDINPSDPNQKLMGGALAWQGKLITSAYSYYDGSSSATKSHWTGTSVSNTSGPYTVGTMNPGFVAGNMGPIPQEWRSLLGGPAFTSQWALAIIGRSSSGPSFTVFDPAQLGVVNPVPATMLIGYPLSNTNPAIGSYTSSTVGPVFNIGTQAGGVAFPDGTRSVLFIYRYGQTSCYGTGTANQALAGTPDGQGNIYCYDPVNFSKGGHGYPYINQVVAYDANDLLAVKNGTKNPWDLVPYAKWRLTDINNNGSFDIRSATYDPATKRIYITPENAEGTPEVHVYQISIGSNIIPPAPDTVAPVVSVTSPSSGATVSGSVSVSANATDNVGVVGVQFKLDGSNLISEDFTSPYSVNWDTSSASNGSHTITAVARDAAGNSATASNITVNVVNTAPPPPQTSPIGHWMLDSTSGTTALDSSGNLNNGTLVNGPVWGTGKIGNALSFDGADDYLNLGSPSTLVPGSKITLAGWVNLSDNSIARMIISKDDGGNNPTFIRTQGSSVRCVIGGTFVGDFGFVGTNTWNHVACTYDGSTVTLYVNGAVVGSSAKTGAIVDNPNNWNIGSRQNGGAMLMKGMLDDIRVYNRALSSSEVSALAINTTPPPPVQVSADIKVNSSDSAVTLTYGSSATVSWTSANANSCTVSPNSWTGTSGSQSTGSLTSNITYSLSCIGANGTATDSVTVNVTNPTSSKFTIGDSVKTTSAVNVRESANVTGALLGSQSIGSTGTVLSGPVFSDGFNWWKIDYATGVDGWSVEDYIVKNTVTNDTTKPLVVVTAPTTFTTVSGIPVFVSVDATDNVGVIGVQFKIDGANLGTEDTTSPYSTIWDTANATEGDHTVSATAHDAAGNVGVSNSVVVTITKTTPTDTTKPTVNITAPIQTSPVSGSITVSANAEDDVAVAGVQFKLDGADLLSEDNVSPYLVTWNTTAVTNGTHTLTAVARDTAGNTQTSASVTVNVNNNNDTLVKPPVVSLTAPTNGSTLTNTVNVSANATDDKGVVGVQFKLDGVNILPEDTTSPYSITWDTKTSTNGSHLLTATARDVEGNQTTSSSIGIGIANNTQSSNLKIGDNVKTTDWVYVRSTPGGKYLGSQRKGRTGKIVDGPGYANGLTWWKVNYTSGVDGWTAEKYLVKSTLAMTDEDYRNNIANIYLVIKYLQERLAGKN